MSCTQFSEEPIEMGIAEPAIDAPLGDLRKKSRTPKASRVAVSAVLARLEIACVMKVDWSYITYGTTREQRLLQKTSWLHSSKNKHLLRCN